MELREIRTFLEVANHNSFSKAAKKLGYSQAAVTIQIKQLEKELKVHLFDRIGKQTTLTHEGEVFYPYAKEVMKSLASAKSLLSQPEELSGSLLIGTIESVCSTLFSALIQEYHRRHPNVNVKLIIDSPETLLSQMNSNAIDLVYFLDKQVFDVKWVKVMEKPEDIIFAASREHKLAGVTDLEVEQVITEPMILTEKDASYRLLFEQYLAAQGKEVHPYLEIGSTAFIVKLLRQNAGISLLPEFAIRKEMEEGRLIKLQMKDFHLQTWRQIVYHKDKWVSREMQSFLELVEEMEGTKEDIKSR